MRKISVCLLVFCSFSAWGGDMQLHAISGNIVGDGSEPLDRLSIVLKRSTGGEPDITAFSGPDGNFEFKRVTEGSVEIQVVTSRGDVIAQQFVQIPSYTAIQIRLPRHPWSTSPRGPVSVYRLQHKSPREALNLWKKAGKAAKKGKNGEAEGLLQQALKVDPEFADAMEQLGVYALQRGDGPTALRHLTAAATLDNGNAAFQRNAAIACLVNQKEPDAERFARLALRLEPGSPQAHYVLGLSLFRQGKDPAQAIESLRVAENSFPRAKTLLQQLLR